MPVDPSHSAHHDAVVRRMVDICMHECYHHVYLYIKAGNTHERSSGFLGAVGMESHVVVLVMRLCEFYRIAYAYWRIPA